jgi:hypothetical protein
MSLSCYSTFYSSDLLLLLSCTKISCPCLIPILYFYKFYLVDFITPMSRTSAQSMVKSSPAMHRTPTTPRTRFKRPITFINKPAEDMRRKEEDENSVEIRSDYSTSC